MRIDKRRIKAKKKKAYLDFKMYDFPPYHCGWYLISHPESEDARNILLELTGGAPPDNVFFIPEEILEEMEIFTALKEHRVI